MFMQPIGINSVNDYLAFVRRNTDNKIAALTGRSLSNQSSSNNSTYSMTPPNFVNIRSGSGSSDCSSQYSSYGLEWKYDKGTYVSLSG